MNTLGPRGLKMYSQLSTPKVIWTQWCCFGCCEDGSACSYCMNTYFCPSLFMQYIIQSSSIFMDVECTKTIIDIVFIKHAKCSIIKVTMKFIHVLNDKNLAYIFLLHYNNLLSQCMKEYHVQVHVQSLSFLLPRSQKIYCLFSVQLGVPVEDLMTSK